MTGFWTETNQWNPIKEWIKQQFVSFAVFNLLCQLCIWYAGCFRLIYLYSLPLFKYLLLFFLSVSIGLAVSLSLSVCVFLLLCLFFSLRLSVSPFVFQSVPHIFLACITSLNLLFSVEKGFYGFNIVKLHLIWAFL